MGKSVHDDVLDASHTKTATGTRASVCSAEPANFAGIAAVSLANVALTPGIGNGDWTVGNGDVSGRKVTLAQQASVPITNSGTATHIAIDDGTILLRVTTCTSQALTAGGTVTIPATDFEIADPT